MKKALLIWLLLIITLDVYGQKRDTFRVYFPLDDPRLNKKARNLIDSLIAKKVFVHGEKITVLGFADYLGSVGYNDSLSTTRAKNVADRLIIKGITKEDIALCIGKGKIDREPVKGKHGYAVDRNVQIIRGWAKKTKPPGNDTSHMIDVSRIKLNVAYPLNILFADASSVILEESIPEMQKLLKFLKNNGTITIQIEGHICCLDPKEGIADGHDKDNGGRLSLTRARSIYAYLVEHGVDKNRLKYIGLANSRPWVRPEVTEEDKKQNRRVEIRILSK